MQPRFRPDQSGFTKSSTNRIRVERDVDRVRLVTRGGYDWTKRYPWIAESALKNRIKHFVIDGEAVVLGLDRGIRFQCAAFRQAQR